MITTELIKKIVEEYFSLPAGSVDLKIRKREIVQARQIAMFFSKSLIKPSLSLAIIGEQIGHKDHATVLYSCKTVNNLIDTDKKFKSDVEEIGKRIRKESISIEKGEIEKAIRDAMNRRFALKINWNKIYKEMLCCD